MEDNTGSKSRVSALSAGFQYAVCVLVGMGLGAYADKHLDSSPWGVLGGLALGMLIGTWSVLRPLWLEAGEADREPKPPRPDDDL